MTVKVTTDYFDEKKNIQLFTLIDVETQISVQLLDYGATIQSLKIPDRNGIVDDIVLGFDDIDGYKGKYNRYFGAVVGRYANRIAKGKFILDNVEYNLAINNGENALHGGIRGFDKVIWNVSEIGSNFVEFSYTSQDGEEGYPGELDVQVKYILKEGGELKIEYRAKSSRSTPVNLTNHSYFNLAGHNGQDQGLYEHDVQFFCDKYLPVNENQIPLTEDTPKGVDDSPFDLRTKQNLGEVLPNCPGGEFNGFDHNFCINGFKSDEDSMNQICKIEHAKSGRVLECYTNQPGVQFYTANFLLKKSDDSCVGKNGVKYHKHGGFCLETQSYPDSPNRKDFPNSILKPKDIYKHDTIFKFTVQRSI